MHAKDDLIKLYFQSDLAIRKHMCFHKVTPEVSMQVQYGGYFNIRVALLTRMMGKSVAVNEICPYLTSPMGWYL